MTNGVRVAVLKDPNEYDVRHLNEILAQESENFVPMTLVDLLKRLGQKELTVFVARSSSNAIVGVVELWVKDTLRVRKAEVENLEVLEGLRRQGIGEKLLGVLIDDVRMAGAKYIDLTSAPRRIKARGLYMKLGFVERNTGVFRLTLPPQNSRPK